MSAKIRGVHLERRAVVYLRQSTLKQVYENRESTTRQYALRDRAISLGWAESRVDTVDEDLGQSGSRAEGRTGYQRLGEDIARGRVGAIFALEVSRLARARTGTGCSTSVALPRSSSSTRAQSTIPGMATTACSSA